MWKDFVEAFGFRFEKKEKFAKASIFVSELQTWIEWQAKAAEYRVLRAAILFGFLGIGLGIVIGSWLAVVTKIAAH